MVKVSFNKALAFKDPKKESLILDVQDSEAAVLVRPQSKVWCWCFCLGLALVLSGVVVGGAFLYRYYMLEVQGIMDGRADERKDAHTSLQMEDQVFVCGLKYFEEDYEFAEEVEVEFEAPLMLLEENVSFFEDDEVELIKVPVPEFRDGDSAGILHDFTMVQKCTHTHTHTHSHAQCLAITTIDILSVN
ncbi:integral membrane protein 2B-like [Sinocyclocheilus rhinocerous]|uniref:integral membrane protein 2B-like n=1 Tax=Sinocyclocheilus rhinocerous TaxID=307959 RepID=UPI0007BAC563|nr:PREDICTED: integral membrane protein 2B-like [Sinocyclocheilus rhinocerous]